MIKIFFTSIKKNWPVIILAAVFGFLVFLPTLFLIYSIGRDSFRGIYPLFNKDEIHYLAMTKEAADGHIGLGSTFIEEYKANSGIQSPLAEIILAGFSKLLHVSIPLLFVINDFVLPFFGFILLYIFFKGITDNNKLAVFFTVMFFLFFLHTFGRPINPQFSFIFLVAGLILIRGIFDENLLPRRKMKYSLVLGAVIGLLIYIYPYFWTALMVLFFVNLLFNSLLFRSVNNLKPAFFMLPVFALLAVPYVVNSLKAAANPFYAETISRFGLLNNHWPACYINVAIVIFTFFILLLSKKYLNRAEFYCAGSFLTSALILNWQNVITGKYLQFSSHYYQVTILFVLTCLLIIFGGVIKKTQTKNNYRDYRRFAAIGLLILLSCYLFYRQRGEIVVGIHNIFPTDQALELQELAPIFNWLNTNTAPDSVVLTDDQNLAGYLSIYTANNNYNYGYAGYYLMSDEELEDRWVRQNIFEDNAIDGEYVFNNNRAIWLNKFIDNYQNKTIREKILSKLTGKDAESIEYVPGHYINRIERKYEDAKKRNLLSVLKKFKIDYIIVGRNNEKHAAINKRLSGYKEVKKIVDINGAIIYRIE